MPMWSFFSFFSGNDALLSSCLPRFHLFEVHDFDFCPSLFRQFLTCSINIYWKRIYQRLLPLFQPIIQNAKQNKQSDAKIRGASAASTANSRGVGGSAGSVASVARFVDLCSGSGGPVRMIQQHLSEHENVNINWTLTDLYPNPPAWKLASQESELNRNSNFSYQLNYVSEPVDATVQSSGISSVDCQTFFASFHHLDRSVAKKILTNAMRAKQPICIVEITERSLYNLLIHPLLVFLGCIFSPFMNRLHWLSNCFFTFIIPIAPVCNLWDYIVSCLRTYSPMEVRQFIDESYQQIQSEQSQSSASSGSQSLSDFQSRWQVKELHYLKDRLIFYENEFDIDDSHSYVWRCGVMKQYKWSVDILLNGNFVFYVGYVKNTNSANASPATSTSKAQKAKKLQ